jgi:hypothetical protein
VRDVERRDISSHARNCTPNHLFSSTKAKYRKKEILIFFNTADCWCFWNSVFSRVFFFYFYLWQVTVNFGETMLLLYAVHCWHNQGVSFIKFDITSVHYRIRLAVMLCTYTVFYTWNKCLFI